MDHWTELYDPKKGRKFRQIPYVGRCDECAAPNGHCLDCPKLTMESLGKLVKMSQAAEEHARERADRYWQMLLEYQGKVAILKHENNQLRKANVRLRSESRGR